MTVKWTKLLLCIVANMVCQTWYSHSSGLHFYDPSEKAYTFIGTVENNKLSFTKRQLAGAEKARALYAGLGFPSVKDFR